MPTGEGGNINGGIAYVTATVRMLIQKPLHFSIPTIHHRKHACVFQTDRLAYSMRLRGNGQWTLQYTPKGAATGTFIVYFLDVEPVSNEGKWITFTLWTFKDVVLEQVNTLTMDLTTFSYDMPAHNQFAMVISTCDPLFLERRDRFLVWIGLVFTITPIIG